MIFDAPVSPNDPDIHNNSSKIENKKETKAYNIHYHHNLIIKSKVGDHSQE